MLTCINAARAYPLLSRCCPHITSRLVVSRTCPSLTNHAQSRIYLGDMMKLAGGPILMQHHHALRRFPLASKRPVMQRACTPASVVGTDNYMRQVWRSIDCRDLPLSRFGIVPLLWAAVSLGTVSMPSLTLSLDLSRYRNSSIFDFGVCIPGKHFDLAC